MYYKGELWRKWTHNNRLRSIQVGLTWQACFWGVNCAPLWFNLLLPEAFKTVAELQDVLFNRRGHSAGWGGTRSELWYFCKSSCVSAQQQCITGIINNYEAEWWSDHSAGAESSPHMFCCVLLCPNTQFVHPLFCREMVPLIFQLFGPSLPSIFSTASPQKNIYGVKFEEKEEENFLNQ